MDHDTALYPPPRPLQCGCGVGLSRFTITGTGVTRQIQLTPAPAETIPPHPTGIVAWAISAAALQDWCAGRPPIHDILDDQGRLLRWRDHAPPPGTRYTCAACGATDLPYLSDDAVCTGCAAYVPLILEFHGYTTRDRQGCPAPQGPSPSQQLNAVLLDYSIPPTAVVQILPGVADCTNGIDHSSLIALLSVQRHVAGHLLHHVAQDAG